MKHESKYGYKPAVIKGEVDPDLKKRFADKCKEEGKKETQVIKRLVKNYLKEE